MGQSAGGGMSAKSASIFSASATSSTGGQEESKFGSGGKPTGGAIFGSTEKSLPKKPIIEVPRGPTKEGKAAQEAEARNKALKAAMTEPKTVDIKKLAPKTGDSNDIKALPAELHKAQASTTEATPEMVQTIKIVDNEPPLNAFEDLFHLTEKLHKLSDNSQADVKVIAGTTFHTRSDLGQDMSIADPESDK